MNDGTNKQRLAELRAKQAGVPERHQLKILLDTVKNPLKGKFLGGPSAEDAEETLRDKFKYTDKQIADLKRASSTTERLAELRAKTADVHFANSADMRAAAKG